MKKNFLGAVIFFSLLALAALSIYIFATRSSSGYRLQELNRTASFLEERIASLERQRDLLGETAAALDDQATALQGHSRELSRRIVQIDAEISNMKDLIDGARKSVKTPLFSLRGFRISAAAGIIVIAFLAFIWLLYTSLRTGEEKESAENPADLSGLEEEGELQPVPGSVMEEEFPPTASADQEPEPDQGPPEASAGDLSPADSAGTEEAESPSSAAVAEKSDPASGDEVIPVEEAPDEERSEQS